MIVEHHTFRLRPGVEVEQFLDLDRVVQTEFAVFRAGFVRRTTARDGDDWLVETLWGGMDDASAAFAADDPALGALRAVIDPATESVRRYETLD